MSGPYLLTYYDAYNHLVDYVASSGSGAAQRDIVRAIQSAYIEVANAHHWDYYDTEGRIQLNAAQTTGTIAFDLTGGTYERQITLSGATWPTWVANGVLVIDNVVYHIESQKSSTVITLTPTHCPAADVTAGETYTLAQLTYALPNDLISMGEPMSEDHWWWNKYVTPNDFQRLNRSDFTTGEVHVWTITGDPNNMSQMAIHVYPAPATSETFDFPYRRRGRQLRLSGHKTAHSQGTIAVSDDSASVTGTSTAFTSDMIGSVIRLGDTTNIPTGLDGLNPYKDQRSIVAVASTTALTLDAAVTEAFSGAKYLITDPVDIDVAMVNLFFRCCEKQIATFRRMKDMASTTVLYNQALSEAKSATKRITQYRFVGDARASKFRRLADYPLGADIE